MTLQTYDDDDSPIDKNGILKDGRRVRVPLMMRDAATVTDIFAADGSGGRGDPSAASLRRPGFRIFWQDAVFSHLARRAKELAYAAYDADLTNAWRGDNPPTGAGERQMRGAAEGDICTTNGAPGHLRRVDGKLVCVPDRRDAMYDPDDDEDEQDPRRRRRGNSAARAAETSADHRTVMDALYQQYDTEIQNAWK